MGGLPIPSPTLRVFTTLCGRPLATEARQPATLHNAPEGSRNSPPLPPSDPLYSPPRPMSIFPEVNALPFCQPKVCFRAGPGAPCGSGPCACLFRCQRDGGHVPEIPITVPDCLPSLNSVYPVCNAPPNKKKKCMFRARGDVPCLHVWSQERKLAAARGCPEAEWGIQLPLAVIQRFPQRVPNAVPLSEPCGIDHGEGGPEARRLQ